MYGKEESISSKVARAVMCSSGGGGGGGRKGRAGSDWEGVITRGHTNAVVLCNLHQIVTQRTAD